MPEGHTLHRLANSLTEAFADHPVGVSSPQGRFAASAAILDGRVLESAEAWGKHLFVSFEGDQLVHVHLGLYGRFEVHPDAEQILPAVGQVRLRLVLADRNGTPSYADLRGATACDLLVPEQRDQLLARLGPDPLRAGSDADLAWTRIKSSRAPMAGLLMNQSVIAGIGNVYRAELLYRHGIDPFRPGSSMRVGRWRAMWEDLVLLMEDGVRTGRIDTVLPEDLTSSERRRSGRRGFNYVYRRANQECRVCGALVRMQGLLGRKLYWCPRCQPRFQSSKGRWARDAPKRAARAKATTQAPEPTN